MPEPLTFDEYDIPSAAPTLGERQGEATIDRSQAAAAASQASAASAEATAEEKRALLPDKTRSSRAVADLNEARAAQAQIALEKTRRSVSSLPTAENVPKARNILLREIRNLVQAKELSQTMFSASGIGYGMLESWPGSPAAQVKGLLGPVTANEGFLALMDLKSQGGTLGQIAIAELEALKAAGGYVPPEGGDEAFQQGMDDLIAKRIELLNKLGVAPDELAEVLGPANAEQFAPMVKSYRFRKEDEAALESYVSTKMADGTFDPTDFAALMGQAYYNATGNTPDEAYVSGAVETGVSLMDKGATTLGALAYESTDEGARKRMLMEAGVLKEDDPSLGETLGGAALNFVPSTFQLAADTAQAFTIDLPDTLEGVAQIVGGAVGLTDPAQWDAVKDYFGERYGTIDGFKRAVKTDPASIAADVAGIATGGALLAAKTAGTAGKLGNIAALSNAAKKAEGFAEVVAKLDPLNTAAAVTKAGGKAVAGTAGRVGSVAARLTGAQPADLVQAAKAGRRGSTEFIDTLEGRKAPEDAIGKADAALSELYQKRSADYTRRMDRLKKQPEMLDFKDVLDAVDNVRNVGRHKGIDISGAAGVWDEVDAKIAEFEGAGLNSIEDFDAMKQSINNIAAKYPRGTPENKVASEVARSINKTITAKAPIYANIMSDYRAASDTLADIKSSISADAKSMDTTLGKLRRSASDKGPRGRRVIDILESTQAGRGLGDMLAGQNLAAAEPNMMGASLGTGASVVTGDPSTMAMSTMSAQGLGRGAYRVGQGMGQIDKARQLLSQVPGADRMAQLAGKYADPMMQGIRVANPVVQSMVDPVPISEPADVDLEALQKAYSVGAPSVVALPGGQVSLGQLQERYTGPTLGGFPPQATPAPVEDGNGMSTVTMGGREVFFDPELGEYVDAATGELVEGYNRGGEVSWQERQRAQQGRVAAARRQQDAGVAQARDTRTAPARERVAAASPANRQAAMRSAQQRPQTSALTDLTMAASRRSNDLVAALADLADHYGVSPANAAAWAAENIEGRSPEQVAMIRRNLQPLGSNREIINAGALSNERRFREAGGLGARPEEEAYTPVEMGAVTYRPQDVPRALVSEVPRWAFAAGDYLSRNSAGTIASDAERLARTEFENMRKDPYGYGVEGAVYSAFPLLAGTGDYAAVREGSRMLDPYTKNDAEARDAKRMVDALSALPLAGGLGVRRAKRARGGPAKRKR